nr:ribosomal protein L7/L12 [Pseudomonas sp. Irchel 3A5]
MDRPTAGPFGRGTTNPLSGEFFHSQSKTMKTWRHMNLAHEGIREFLINGVVVGDLPLPTHYAQLDRLDDFQAGFRTHGNTGESLVSDTEGEWNPDWYVLALTGLDDPVFIAATEASRGYPVYTAVHGAGRWDAIQIASSLVAFRRLLEALAEVKDDTVEFNRLIMAEIGSGNRYWREVIDARQEAELLEQSTPEISAYDPADFESGDLIVTAFGPHKLKVIQLISKAGKLSLKEALALADAPEFKAGRGKRLQLRQLRDHLEALGATVEFRPD